ncbi:MAG: DUF3099 domain-containing protein [Marmoricola sp.]
MSRRKRDSDADVVRITGAPQNLGDDIANRQRRYLISMTIRTLCFIGAVVFYKIPIVCIILIVASFLLPFVAVVIANAAAPRTGTTPEGPGVGLGPDYRALGGSEWEDGPKP